MKEEAEEHKPCGKDIDLNAIPAEDFADDGTPLWKRLLGSLVAPLVLIIAVLGSILGGLASPTEAAAVGASWPPSFTR